MAILAILSAIAIPGFSHLKKEKVKSISNALHTDLAYARLEAMRSKFPVSLCKSSAESKCEENNASNWSGAGWLIFTDKNQNLNLDVGENVLLFHTNSSKEITLISNGSFGLTYFPDGSVRTQNNKKPHIF